MMNICIINPAKTADLAMLYQPASQLNNLADTVKLN